MNVQDLDHEPAPFLYQNTMCSLMMPFYLKMDWLCRSEVGCKSTTDANGIRRLPCTMTPLHLITPLFSAVPLRTTTELWMGSTPGTWQLENMHYSRKHYHWQKVILYVLQIQSLQRPYVKPRPSTKSMMLCAPCTPSHSRVLNWSRMHSILVLSNSMSTYRSNAVSRGLFIYNYNYKHQYERVA